jgi:peptidoglycan-associated lipoprotein
MKKRVFLAVALAALLAGCASGVKLDQPPVEDRSASQVQPNTGSGQPGGAASRVAPVDATAGALNQAGPAGVGRIIYFDFDSNSIQPQYQSLIEQNARFLRADSRRHVVIEGHTDERGGSEYNLALGQRRSEAVRQALELLGVKDSQVEAVSFGKEKPAVEGHDESAWAKNRRAEIAYR